ncbi:MAG: hypothetical protein Q9221_006848 [Calogaya cf. arnoldii]
MPSVEIADMDNVTSEHANMPHTHNHEDAEVEDGEIEDNSLIDPGPMQETTKDRISPTKEHFPPPPPVESRPQSVPEPSAVPSVLMNGGESLHPAVRVKKPYLV